MRWGEPLSSSWTWVESSGSRVGLAPGKLPWDRLYTAAMAQLRRPRRGAAPGRCPRGDELKTESRSDHRTEAAGRPRGWLLAGVALVGGLAYLNNLLWAFLLIYSAVLVALLAATWSWWCARHLRLFREAEEGRHAVGQLLVERFTLENDSGLPIRLVEVQDRSRVPGARAARSVSLAPRQIVTWDSNRRLLARGRYELGPTELRLSDPFGLFPRRLLLPSNETLVVYPAQVAVPGRSLPRGPARPGTGGHQPGPSRTQEEPQRLRSLPRSWNRRRLPEAWRPDTTDLLVLLDLRRASHHGEGPDSSLEYAVTLAASVAHAAAAQGRAVALAASDREMRRIPAGRGELHDRALLEYLATARDDGEVPFSQLIRRELNGWRGRGGVVLITADDDQQWVEAAARGSAPGGRALAIFIDPSGFLNRAPTKTPTQWQLVLDLWVVRHGDDLSRLDTRHGRAVV